MPAGIYNIVCEQGATFRRELVWRDSSEQPVNLQGYTARMQVRPNIKSAIVLVDLTTENARLVLDAADGKVTMTLSATTTATFTPKQYVYDLELVAGNEEVTRLLQGTFTVVPEVTR